MMIILPVLGAMWEGFSGLIPFMRVSASMGLFGMGTFSKLFFLGSFVHGLRIWRRMIHMEREQHSAYEGPPLPIFRIVPGSFWLIRIVYEPAFVFVLSIVLANFLHPAARRSAFPDVLRRHARDEAIRRLVYAVAVSPRTDGHAQRRSHHREDRR